MINTILNSAIELHVSSTGNLMFKGPANYIEQLKSALRQWKPELLNIIAGKSIGDVGQCEDCGTELIGFLVEFDHYTNRVCPECGTWAICLPPDWTPKDLDELIGERAAIMEHHGNENAEEVDSLAKSTIKHQLHQQRFELRLRASKSINKVAADLAGPTAESSNLVGS